jgi:hypothetical protein
VDPREISRQIRDGAAQVVAGLRQAVALDLPTAQLAQVLEAAFTERNKIDSAVSGAIGALDRAARADDHSTTRGLDCADLAERDPPHQLQRPPGRARRPDYSPSRLCTRRATDRLSRVSGSSSSAPVTSRTRSRR